MKITILLLLFASCFLNSCALDKLFLHPFDLNENSQMTVYSKEYSDTISIEFNRSQPLFYHSNGEIVNLKYNIESSFIENSNGDSLNTWLISPKENFNGKLIYFLHGNAGNILYQFTLATPFVERGYKVFMIDYSEFGFSEGEATRKNVLQDGFDGMDYLINHPEIERKSITIYGQSLGGHLSILVANKYQNKIDGVVAEGAFSSHSSVAGNRVPILGNIFVRELYSAKKTISNIKKPILIIHSTEDKTVKYKHGKKLYKKANSPKEFYTIDKPHVLGPLYFADSITYKMSQF
jgi:pimeloyl-ACP methyl ester carboxylesterase